MEFGEMLPVEYATLREAALQKEVDNLKKEVERLRIENSVYKEIIKR